MIDQSGQVLSSTFKNMSFYRRLYAGRQLINQPSSRYVLFALEKDSSLAKGSVSHITEAFPWFASSLIGPQSFLKASAWFSAAYFI